MDSFLDKFNVLHKSLKVLIILLQNNKGSFLFFTDAL